MKRADRRLAVVIACLFLAAAAPGHGQYTTAKLARSSNAFGFDLYQRLRQKPGNLVVSPVSITTALTMAWAGARGETAAQMRKALHLEGTAGEVTAASGWLARALQDPARPVIVRIANQLFGEESYKLAPAYLKKTAAAFGAPVELLDFAKAPEPSRVHINQWIESKTEHRIKDLIPSGGVAPDTKLVLVNAIYFLGDWARPFGSGDTKPAPFHLTAVAKKDVPTMHLLDELRIARKDGVTAVQIPYKGEELSMMLLVPDRIDGLAAVESTLDSRTVDGLLSAMQYALVELALPRFDVHPDALSLGEDLKALGMPLALDRGRADFTGIANPPNPADRLSISKVFHQGFVRVNERGTEAGAATAVALGPTGPPEAPRRLNADRPFLFLIRDNASGLVLFLGRVSDPGRR
jgi:serpin B